MLNAFNAFMASDETENKYKQSVKQNKLKSLFVIFFFNFVKNETACKLTKAKDNK